jgi:hypothetical protein
MKDAFTIVQHRIDGVPHLIAMADGVAPFWDFLVRRLYPIPLAAVLLTARPSSKSTPIGTPAGLN